MSTTQGVGASSKPGLNTTYAELLQDAQKLDGALGAIAFAVLEMFRRGGMTESEVHTLHEKMKVFFRLPSNEECNAICKMVETRLQKDKRDDNGLWYR